MKIFFYKTLFVAFVFFVVFKLTVGTMVKEIENIFYDNFSKENIEKVKQNLIDKLRKREIYKKRRCRIN